METTNHPLFVLACEHDKCKCVITFALLRWGDLAATVKLPSLTQEHDSSFKKRKGTSSEQGKRKETSVSMYERGAGAVLYTVTVQVCVASMTDKRVG